MRKARILHRAGWRQMPQSRIRGRGWLEGQETGHYKLVSGLVDVPVVVLFTVFGRVSDPPFPHGFREVR